MQHTVRNTQFAHTMRCNDRDVDYLNRVNVIFIFISRKMSKHIYIYIYISLRFNFVDYTLSLVSCNRKNKKVKYFPPAQKHFDQQFRLICLLRERYSRRGQ